MTQLESTQLAINERLNWKVKFLVGGAVVGALVGVGTSYLMARNSEENHGGPPEVKTMDILKIAISLFGLVRGIAALGGD